MSTLNGRALRTVVKRTANLTLTAADNGSLITNEGASGAITISLPPATVGLWFDFDVEAAQALQVDPNGTDKAALHTGVMQAAGKYVTSSTAGNRLSLECVKAGEWRAKCAIGTWTAEA